MRWASCRPRAPRPSHPPPRACASCPSSSGMLLPLLRSSCFPSSSPGGGGSAGGSGLGAGAGSQPAEKLPREVRGPPGALERAGAEPGIDPRRAAEAEGAPGPEARGPGAGGGGRRAEREPYACMDPGAALQRRAGGGGLGTGSPALSGGQARRRKQPPRPADFKLQVIIIGSRGVGKTSLMERFTDDTFCEACKSTVGKGCAAGRAGAGLCCRRRCLPSAPRAPAGALRSVGLVSHRVSELFLPSWLVLHLVDGPVGGVWAEAEDPPVGTLGSVPKAGRGSAV